MEVSHRWDFVMVFMILGLALLGVNRIFRLWERREYSPTRFILVYILYIVVACFFILVFANIIERDDTLWRHN
jgi:predicted membrane channel-forming protein YqfA (hemolysin III family)